MALDWLFNWGIELLSKRAESLPLIPESAALLAFIAKELGDQRNVSAPSGTLIL
jgi:hypothetical protein